MHILALGRLANRGMERSQSGNAAWNIVRRNRGAESPLPHHSVGYDLLDAVNHYVGISMLRRIFRLEFPPVLLLGVYNLRANARSVVSESTLGDDGHG